jgi:hypothetical protein
MFLVWSALPLFSRDFSLFEGTDLKNRDVETINLNEAGKGKLKLGISLGYPVTGLTAGWNVGKSMEMDLLVGSWNYDSFCLGGSAMFSLVDLEIGTEIFPLSAGPFLYTGVSNNYLSLGLGGIARMEYTFDFRLNLYLESGLAVVLQNSNATMAVPFGLGIRYVF